MNADDLAREWEFDDFATMAQVLYVTTALSVRELAERLGVSKSWLARELAARGLSKARGTPPKCLGIPPHLIINKNAEDLARMYQVSARTIYRARAELRRVLERKRRGT